MSEALPAAYPKGGTCTRIGVLGCSGQSGILHTILVTVYDVTTHGRPLHASTVGAPVPRRKPLPLIVRVSLTAATVLSAPVTVAVWAAANLKEHGNEVPVLDNLAGSA